jgi:hypothetical protein
MILLYSATSLTMTGEMAGTTFLFPLFNILLAFYILGKLHSTQTTNLPLTPSPLEPWEQKYTQTCLNLVSFVTTAVRIQHSLDINEEFQ